MQLLRGAFAITSLTVVACVNAPSVAERMTQQIVVTKFNPQADFTQIRTFAVPDQIFVLSTLATGGGTTPEFVDDNIAQQIIGEVATELTSRGYVQVGRNEGPDIGVAITGINQIRVPTVAYGAWFGTGSATPVFWGYSGGTLVVPFQYATTAWQSGTLVIELEDLRAVRDATAGKPQPPPAIAAAAAAANPATTVPVVVDWAALIHGIIGPAGTILTTAPIAAIQQAFEQSPYLHR